jgi:hypothetical protein
MKHHACIALGLGLCMALPAAAEFSISAGVESFRWDEATTPSVSEDGPLFALGLAYTQEKDRGLLFAYRGRAYIGDVDYNGSGLFTGAPIQGTTSYTGMANELQARWRLPAEQEYRVDFLFGLGLDIWERQLTSFQSEDYRIGYLRLGAEMAPAAKAGWTVGGGIKYPFYTDEDAHLTEIGFDSNPTLKPEGNVSFFAQVGYHFNEKFRLIAYYDSFDFDDSPAEPVNHSLTGPITVYQPASEMRIIGLKLEYRIW